MTTLLLHECANKLLRGETVNVAVVWGGVAHVYTCETVEELEYVTGLSDRILPVVFEEILTEVIESTNELHPEEITVDM